MTPPLANRRVLFTIACLGMLAIHGSRPAGEAITKDPASFAATVEPNAGPASPAGMRTPMAAATGNRAKQRPKLDTPIEPWTGEDLAPRIATSQARMLKVDTSDPWDPNVRGHLEPRHEMEPYEDVYASNAAHQE